MANEKARKGVNIAQGEIALSWGDSGQIVMVFTDHFSVIQISDDEPLLITFGQSAVGGDVLNGKPPLEGVIKPVARIALSAANCRRLADLLLAAATHS